ncbi:MAG: hypothetical protein QXO15_12540 [Nitrososphaerota archaeon]
MKYSIIRGRLLTSKVFLVKRKSGGTFTGLNFKKRDVFMEESIPA